MNTKRGSASSRVFFDMTGPESASGYGRFIEDGHCFETTGEPPRKWTNLHYNGFGGWEVLDEVSHIGDGPLVVRDPEGRQCTVVGYEGKYLYIRDDDNLRSFCPGGGPVATEVDSQSVRFYPERTELHASLDGIQVCQRVFVPAQYCVEVSTLTLANHSERPRRLSVFAFAKFGVGPRLCARPEPRAGGVFAWSYSSAEPDRFQRAFLGFQSDCYAATAHRDAFLRPEYSPATPRILWETDLVERGGYDFEAIGAAQAKRTLDPGETVRLDILLGHAESVDGAANLRSELTPDRIDSLCREQEARERERAEGFSIEIGHSNLEALMNHFVKKQLYAYLMAKSGFRDNLQLAQALALVDLPLAQSVVEKALASQHSEGWAPACFRPLKNSKRADKPAWILSVVPSLVKESGDPTWLERELPFQDGSEKASLREHLLRAMRYLAEDTGPNGLCDLHEGDWNDGLSPRGATGGRESVMVTQQFCHGLREIAELARWIGEDIVAAEAEELFATFAERLNRIAWDGGWYRRVLCEDGFIIGTADAEEGRIFMNTQSWAVLSGTAPPERANACMDAVEEHLALDIGYRVCAPPFTKFDSRIGLASATLPGHIENGGCYNHAAGFKAVADCVLKRPEQAWRTFRKVAPDNPDNPVSRSRMEPFAFVNMFFAHEFGYGEAFYPWRTGTGAWMTQLIAEWILGARRDYPGLRIDPCLPKAIPQARIRRKFRGACFDIRIDNREGRGHGPREIKLDGQAIGGSCLPDLRDGEHQVEVLL